jgi:hypothetical protein
MSQPAAQRENFLEYWQMAEAAEAASYQWTWHQQRRRRQW